MIQAVVDRKGMLWLASGRVEMRCNNKLLTEMPAGM